MITALYSHQPSRAAGSMLVSGDSTLVNQAYSLVARYIFPSEIIRFPHSFVVCDISLTMAKFVISKLRFDMGAANVSAILPECRP